MCCISEIYNKYIANITIRKFAKSLSLFHAFKNISATTRVFVWFRCTNLILKNQHPETKKLTRNNLLQISEANFILHKDKVLENGSVWLIHQNHKAHI